MKFPYLIIIAIVLVISCGNNPLESNSSIDSLSKFPNPDYIECLRVGKIIFQDPQTHKESGSITSYDAQGQPIITVSAYSLLTSGHLSVKGMLDAYEIKERENNMKISQLLSRVEQLENKIKELENSNN